MQKKLDKFDMKDIHSGYVVKFRNGKYALCMRVGAKFTKIFACLDTASLIRGSAEESTFVYTNNYKGHAYYRYSLITRQYEQYPDFDIVAVYGLIEGVKNYLDISVCNDEYRPLLWEEPVIQMTLEEIEKKLGHKVEIVEPKKLVGIKGKDCDKCVHGDNNECCGISCTECKSKYRWDCCKCNTVMRGKPCPYFKEEEKK